MYKYLSLTADIHEMMVMMNSLPTCTIVFDRFGKLVEINQPAMTFLGIKDIDDYRLKRWMVLNEPKFIKETIRTLATGIIVRDDLYIAKCPNKSSVILSFNACLLNGTKQAFLFQFFELSGTSSLFLKEQSTINLLSNYYLGVYTDNELNDEIHNHLSHKEKKRLFWPKVDDDLFQSIAKSISEKYPSFSNREIFICVLIALRINTNQIAMITHYKLSYIYAIIHRMLKRSNYKSRKQFNEDLIDIYNRDV